MSRYENGLGQTTSLFSVENTLFVEEYGVGFLAQIRFVKSSEIVETHFRKLSAINAHPRSFAFFKIIL